MMLRLLKECCVRKQVGLGRCVHALAARNGHEYCALLGNQFLRMYAAYRTLEEANQAFSKLHTPDVIGWTLLISAHCEKGQAEKAIQLYMQMRESNVKADNYLYVAVLKACTSVGDIKSGQLVHADVMDSGLESNQFVGNTLVNMYSKCGRLDDARTIFDRLPMRNVVTWTAMVSGYCQHGLSQDALHLYLRMQAEGVRPNNLTYLAALKACGSLGAMQEGQRIHAQVLVQGLQTDLFVGSALITMYAECGNLEGARNVFDSMPSKNVVTWTTMISCCTQHGLGQEALELYGRMQEDGVVPDKVTLGSVLTACGSVGALQVGKQIHAQIVERGLDTDVAVSCMLLHMYIECACLDKAREVFDRLSTTNVVPWTAMVSGYTRHGRGQEALELYQRMEQNHITPDPVAFVSVIGACGNLGAIQEGRRLHAQLARLGLDTNLFVGSALINMYAKCGSLSDAQGVFDKVPARNAVTWTAMIDCYGQHNQGGMAVRCFEHMLLEGVKPDSATFICLLTACSHVGLVREGQHYFDRMKEDHGIVPLIEHYNCVADLLSRAGRLDEAESFLLTMSIKADSVGWMSLLTACETYSSLEHGRRCFDRLMEIDPTHAAGYVLMANIYANAGRSEDANRTEDMRTSAGALKKAAKALIEVKGKVHEFIVGEEGFFKRDYHEPNFWGVDLKQKHDIVEKLKSLSVEMKEGGHVPHTYLVLKPISNKEKEDALCGHAEKLAVAFGLLNTPQGSPLLVVKNLRMCKDCHSGTKIISKIERRDIIVRDAHRVHHFAAGACSCGDRP